MAEECTQLARVAQQPVAVQVYQPLEFTDNQQQMIRDVYANGASNEEFFALIEMAKARRLNPILKQVYFVKRWDSNKKREVWSVQVSIDGMRAIAERTGKYDGQDEPEFILDEKGQLVGCKVRVYRKDWSRPAVGLIYLNEYVQTNKEGKPTQFWNKMPHVMAAKCAESAALRKAFPEDTSGLYIPEEMMNDINRSCEYEVEPEPAQQRPALPPAPKAAPAQQPKPQQAPKPAAKDFLKAISDASTEAELNAVGAEIGKVIGKNDPQRGALIDAFKARKAELATPPPEPPGPAQTHQEAAPETEVHQAVLEPPVVGQVSVLDEILALIDEAPSAEHLIGVVAPVIKERIGQDSPYRDTIKAAFLAKNKSFVGSR